MSVELKPCPPCGRKLVVEHWSSGGTMYMVKCNNPDCPMPVESYPNGHKLDEVITEWNQTMGRLIDANLLGKGIKKWLKPSKPDEDEYISITDALVSILQEIEEQPTAYDVDKVVEQLENERKFWENAGKEKARSYEHAIEIVKGGGVDDN